MSSGSFTESVVEKAALAWLAGLGWQVKHGPEIAQGSRPLSALIRRIAMPFSSAVCARRSRG